MNAKESKALLAQETAEVSSAFKNSMFEFFESLISSRLGVGHETEVRRIRLTTRILAQGASSLVPEASVESKSAEAQMLRGRVKRELLCNQEEITETIDAFVVALACCQTLEMVTALKRCYWTASHMRVIIFINNAVGRRTIPSRRSASRNEPPGLKPAVSFASTRGTRST